MVLFSVMKSKENLRKKIKHSNILNFPFLFLTTEVEDIWMLMVESKNLCPLRLESA